MKRRRRRPSKSSRHERTLEHPGVDRTKLNSILIQYQYSYYNQQFNHIDLILCTRRVMGVDRTRTRTWTVTRIGVLDVRLRDHVYKINK